ncbi:DUF4179 domain-containing protein [Lysinibacillus yapensis]|uniref:DUF4179 domain-containing protein n=1 Tax=Ureibacillus yapensis TaxID=2304605 RepID=A0A396S8R3_9BACL|nr:DUF4179 domain-containing protein [Lysinibacillus yapensis]RHW37475.1 DUF4179 domain-containing protein [Lysinibacillus yapensis]
MERIEEKLKEQMKTSMNIPYPDFDQMWNSIQQDELKDANIAKGPLRPRNRKRLALVTGLSIALLATPVYAALTYDWSNILFHKAGIQSALEQGFGQNIGQSVTKNGVTLTVHTAFIDDNRTFLLYTLKPEAAWSGKNLSFDAIGLKNQNGNYIEGNYVHNWNEELGLFQGYFETDWIVEGKTADVTFTIENVHFLDDGNQAIKYNPNNPETQIFSIQKDGIDRVSIQSFEQAENRVLLQSSVAFMDPEMANRSWVRIQAVNPKNELIPEAEPAVFGTPGASNEYLSQQIFESDTLLVDGSKFQLAYDRKVETADGTWSLNLALSKKQLENVSFREVLNLPVDEMVAGTEIEDITVTPTQIRLVLDYKEKYTRVPYMDYHLEVGDTRLNGDIWLPDVPGNPKETELRFEMDGLDAASLANQPVTLIAKHRVDAFKGNDTPIHLTDISTEHQRLTTHIEGYPITWTYYMKDDNLYVESLSPDPAFGGVNQTYYLQGKDRNYGEPLLIGIMGDENNKNMDVYENFDNNELDIYIANYSTQDRNNELRVELLSGK